MQASVHPRVVKQVRPKLTYSTRCHHIRCCYRSRHS